MSSNAAPGASAIVEPASRSYFIPVMGRSIGLAKSAKARVSEFKTGDNYESCMHRDRQSVFLLGLRDPPVVDAAISPHAHGQQQATLSGIISDPSGAVVPDAAIRVIDHATQVTRTAVTNATGYYLVLNLTPGYL